MSDRTNLVAAQNSPGVPPSATMRPNYLRVGHESYTYFHLIFDRSPRSTPPAFWRSVGALKSFLRVTSLCLILSLGLLLTGAIVDRGLTLRLLEQGGIFLVSGLIVVHSVVGLYGFRFAVGRYRRFLKEHQWLVCMRCGYVLEHLPPCHKCPECGDAYDFEALRLSWQEWAKNNIAYGAK